MRALALLVIFCPFVSIVFAEEVLLRDLDVQSSLRLSEYVKANDISMDSPVKQMLLNIDDRKIRARLYGEIGGAIRENQNLSLDKKIALTDLFVTGLNDKDRRYYVSDRLRLPPFEREYFSEEAKSVILNQGMENIRDNFYLRILAVADIKDSRVDTLTLSQQEKPSYAGDTGSILEALNVEHFAFYDSNMWTSLVVEARYDNRDALQRILDHVNEAGLQRMTSRFEAVEDLGFIRQPEAIDVLVDFLFSDYPTKDAEMNGHVGVVPLSFRAAKALSLSLADYPFDYWDDFEYSKVQKAREFINNYEGEWRIIGKPQTEEEQSVEVAQVTEEITSLKPAIEKSVQVAVAKPIEEDAEQPSNWWLWLIGAIIVLIGIVSLYRAK